MSADDFQTAMRAVSATVGSVPAETTIATARRLLDDRAYCALLAVGGSSDIGGVIGLNECKAIYAHGPFGEIAELYVEPRFRSAGVGKQLVEAAVAHGRSRNWSMIEVGAPDVPRWQSTVDFYLRRGFVEVGPGSIASSRPARVDPVLRRHEGNLDHDRARLGQWAAMP